jgi:hypothetical protein
MMENLEQIFQKRASAAKPSKMDKKSDCNIAGCEEGGSIAVNGWSNHAQRCEKSGGIVANAGRGQDVHCKSGSIVANAGGNNAEGGWCISRFPVLAFAILLVFVSVSFAQACSDSLPVTGKLCINHVTTTGCYDPCGTEITGCAPRDVWACPTERGYTSGTSPRCGLPDESFVDPAGPAVYIFDGYDSQTGYGIPGGQESPICTEKSCSYVGGPDHGGAMCQGISDSDIETECSDLTQAEDCETHGCEWTGDPLDCNPLSNLNLEIFSPPDPVMLHFTCTGPAECGDDQIAFNSSNPADDLIYDPGVIAWLTAYMMINRTDPNGMPSGSVPAMPTTYFNPGQALIFYKFTLKDAAGGLLYNSAYWLVTGESGQSPYNPYGTISPGLVTTINSPQSAEILRDSLSGPDFDYDAGNPTCRLGIKLVTVKRVDNHISPLWTKFYSSNVAEYDLMASLCPGGVNQPPSAPATPTLTPIIAVETTMLTASDVSGTSTDADGPPLPPEQPLPITYEYRFYKNGALSQSGAARDFDCLIRACAPSDVIFAKARACDGAPLCGAESAASNSVTIQDPPPQQPSNTGWQAYSIMALLIGFALIALLYMADKVIDMVR